MPESFRGGCSFGAGVAPDLSRSAFYANWREGRGLDGKTQGSHSFLDIAVSRSHVSAMKMPPLTILLAAPRGFCAGVVRAIDIVERALALYGAPVYVRHEIVHNKFVVDDLKSKGVNWLTCRYGKNFVIT